jgi:murein DD-endopeptidase MepM/ murein hydrolase activator NlpD
VIPNIGIDVATSPGDAVRVVADGIVSAVSFIPVYGNLLIVFHDDGFRTVYAHLSSISVREGQRVKAGQTIARSALSADGAQIHFGVWRDRSKLNPLSWLAGR